MTARMFVLPGTSRDSAIIALSLPTRSCALQTTLSWRTFGWISDKGMIVTLLCNLPWSTNCVAVSALSTNYIVQFSSSWLMKDQSVNLNFCPKKFGYHFIGINQREGKGKGIIDQTERTKWRYKIGGRGKTVIEKGSQKGRRKKECLEGKRMYKQVTSRAMAWRSDCLIFTK